MIRLIIFTAICTAFFLGCANKNKSDLGSNKAPNQQPLQGNLPIPTPTPAPPPQIIGFWKSISPEPAGNGNYVVREYRLTFNQWEETLTLASGKDMLRPIYIYRAQGTYIIDLPMQKKPGAFLLLLGTNKKSLTLKSKDKLTLNELDLNTCQLQLNKEKDISSVGCSEFKPLKNCEQEFDILKIENGNLYFGDRTGEGDLCSEDRRPEAFGPGLKKLN